MTWWPLNHLPRGRFTRRLTLLAGGMLIGQLLLVVATPLLTRLYSPDAFGFFGVFAAFVGIFGTIMAGRYEFAIPLAARDEEAAALAVAGIVVTCFLTVVSIPLVWAFGQPVANATGIPALASLLWLLPLCLFLSGIGQPLEYLSIRRDTMRLNASTRVAQYGSQAASQLALGAAGTGAIGLTIGYGLGYFVRAALFIVYLSPDDRRSLRTTRFARVREIAWAMRRYPFLSSVSTLVKSLTQFLPTIMFAAFFGPAVAGGFDLAQRILAVPVRLVASSASEVFLADASHRSGADSLRLFSKAVPRFLLLGLVGMAPIVIAGPVLFAFVFGEPWREAGAFAQALVALQLARFVQGPTSQSFNILGRQDLELKTALLGAIVLAATFGLIALLNAKPATAVLIYSIASGLGQLFLLYLSWQITRKAALEELHKSSG